MLSASQINIGLFVHVYWCFSLGCKHQQQTCLRCSSSCMAATAETNTHTHQSMCNHTLFEHAESHRHTHISRETSCRLQTSCMAATEVLAVAGADGGGSCGDGLAAPTPIFTAEIKKKKKNAGKNTTAAAVPFGRARSWDVTGVRVLQIEKHPDGFFWGSIHYGREM